MRLQKPNKSPLLASSFALRGERPQFNCKRELKTVVGRGHCSWLWLIHLDMKQWLDLQNDCPLDLSSLSDYCFH